MVSYSVEEKHLNKFGEARSLLDQADKQLNDKVKPVIDDYASSKQAELLKQLGEVEVKVARAKELGNDPATWIKRVDETRANPAAVVTTATQMRTADVAANNQLVHTANTAKVSWPAQSSEIDKRVKAVTDKQIASAEAVAKLEAEAAKSSPNYAVMRTLADQADALHRQFTDGDRAVRGQLAELSVAETHTVVDMRVDGEIEVSRTSWDENVDGGEQDYSYPAIKSSDAELLAYMSGIAPGSVIAKTDGGFWGSSFNLTTDGGIDRKMWDKMKIDHDKDRPSGHNSAEYYLDAIEFTTCYKLKVLKDGKPDASGAPKGDDACKQYTTASDRAAGMYWTEAEEANFDVIGMDIYSKAPGDFADQATDAASPPGIVYVGNPQYGEWKQSADGTSFWEFYGPYLFFQRLIGGSNPHYYRSEFDTWNRDYRRKDRDYYAGTAAAPRFGAASAATASRFPNGNYSKSKLGSVSVRSAGPSLRGGGPGGGGK